MQVIIEPSTMFWRQMGGHLKKIETSSVGVTWGIGYDCTAWVYTGGWGGAFLKGMFFRRKQLQLKCLKINLNNILIKLIL